MLLDEIREVTFSGRHFSAQQFRIPKSLSPTFGMEILGQDRTTMENYDRFALVAPFLGLLFVILALNAHPSVRSTKEHA